jgi:hypothetical protein
MRNVTCGVMLLAVLAVGCGSKGSEPGKVVVTSTADLGKVGVGSSPPPVVPPK